MVTHPFQVTKLPIQYYTSLNQNCNRRGITFPGEANKDNVNGRPCAAFSVIELPKCFDFAQHDKRTAVVILTAGKDL